MVREPEHIHPHQRSRFIIEQGTLNFMVDGELRLVGPGHEITIARGVPHHFWNEGNGDARYLQEFSPALSMGDFFEMYFYLAAQGKLGEDGRPSLLQTLVLIDAYWNEVRLCSPPPLLGKLLAFLFAPLGRVLGFSATAPSAF